ncbi:restriction endonuclease subunit S [Acinetobacter baumannii]|uniref:restriction endonuclease subunit S n=1 Tax=Acinetobacter baumannii TaxID=470 RepID=UPI0018A94423|nr:restriction endonuclease subunit S [Acinetobacter baumannii]EKU0940057.1 restriction endonuclease subunit S [Acinetobacter baumannii]EKX7142157.1 restriction endonuclease subunit S [Acinetobacter baumannii]MCZ2945670.1 restriction endonuclease subunit S [Acinetobacter baumannii]MCZ3333553.1 restriction endonuclease subunit S [Acinetobacter baumannii]
MAKYQKYVEYKDSGCEWTDKLPIHWNSVHLKWISTIYAGGTPSKTIESYWENGTIPWINSGAVNQTYILEPSTYITQTAYENSSAKWIPQKALVMALAGQGKTKGMVAQLGINTTCNQSMGAIIPNDLSYARYLFWWITSNYQNIRNMAGGDLRDGLNLEHLGDMDCPLPNDEEIKKIANFLDHETTKIDTLIAKQEKLIELLKEKRQAVISHAVTKGLNPNVPMKDSGVEWLGEVPEHWGVIAISKVTQKITNGYVGPTRDILVEDGIPYVQATHIKKGKVNFDNAYFVREKWSNDHAKSILKKDDVLIVQTGAGTGDVGLVSEAEEGFNCHALIILQPKKKQLSGNYLAYCLQSDYGYATLYSIRTGGMHPHLNCGEVQFVKIPVPPLNEQITISDFIEKNIRDFDSLVEKAESAIQLMQERRTALISAAVTGKIDVRHWQSPNKNNNQDNMELSA